MLAPHITVPLWNKSAIVKPSMLALRLYTVTVTGSMHVSCMTGPLHGPRRQCQLCDVELVCLSPCSATADPGVLNRAEWIKFVALFFNKEIEANKIFTEIVDVSCRDVDGMWVVCVHREGRVGRTKG